MKLIVGLGNPGPEYERTRHNAGWLALDRLARRHAPGGVVKSRFGGALVEAPIGPERCLLLKPLNYMNRSGSSVAEAVNFYKLNLATDVLLLVDEAALPLGTIRIRGEGSPGGHNGLADVQRALGTEAYPRCRIGIDPPPPPMSLHDYVLGRFTAEQMAALEPALEKTADAAEVFVTKGLQAAMNRFNVRPPPPPPPPPTAPATGAATPSK